VPKLENPRKFFITPKPFIQSKSTESEDDLDYEKLLGVKVSLKLHFFQNEGDREYRKIV